ncbi:Hypothetical_protein [Hexamita inflata]|uniref:Hypothetical_protein n=1 Tax=Hexamita inflata TaxID=28002 RepID=A0AA86RBK2_9EUKA|nr:Hypothetical protein HINF_LOCUS62060 [Hexamita inflata]
MSYTNISSDISSTFDQLIYNSNMMQTNYDENIAIQLHQQLIILQDLVSQQQSQSAQQIKAVVMQLEQTENDLYNQQVTSESQQTTIAQLTSQLQSLQSSSTFQLQSESVYWQNQANSQMRELMNTNNLLSQYQDLVKTLQSDYDKLFQAVSKNNEFVRQQADECANVIVTQEAELLSNTALLHAQVNEHLSANHQKQHKLSNEVKQLKSQNNELAKQCSAYQQREIKYENTLQLTQSELEQLESELSTEKTRFKAVQDQFNVLSAQNNQLKRQQEVNQSVFAEKTFRIQILEEQNGILQQKQLENGTQVQNTLGQYQNTIMLLNTAKNQRDELQKMLEGKQAELNQLQNATSKRIEQLSNEIIVQNEQISEYEREIAQQAKQIALLQAAPKENSLAIEYQKMYENIKNQMHEQQLTMINKIQNLRLQNDKLKNNQIIKKYKATETIQKVISPSFKNSPSPFKEYKIETTQKIKEPIVRTIYYASNKIK